MIGNESRDWEKPLEWVRSSHNRSSDFHGIGGNEDDKMVGCTSGGSVAYLRL